MVDDSHAISAERFARLERRHRFLSAVCGVLVVAMVFLATYTPNTIRANAFHLMSADGIVRAELTIRGEDAGLFVKDLRGMDRVAVFHDSTTSGMYVFDSTGTTRIGVAQFSHGGGGFALHGPDSKGAAVLYLKGDGSLRFFDTEGTVTNQVLSVKK